MGRFPKARQAELAELFGWPPAHVQWIPNGLDPARFLGASADMRTLLGQVAEWDRNRVLLAPVRMTRCTNLELALAVVAELKAAGHRLLLPLTSPPGPHNPHQDYVTFLAEERRRRAVDAEVQFLSLPPRLPNGVSAALMLEFYWWADALLFPTLQAGFGLPLLETGLARLPTFCTDLPVLREAGGAHVHHFSPQAQPHAIATQIASVLSASEPATLRRRVGQVYNGDLIYRRDLLPLLRQ